MILTEQLKQRARVHIGVPMMGVQDSGQSLGYRYQNVIGLFEWRLNNLQPYEYASVVGLPTGGVLVQGTPQLGGTVTITINGTPYTYTIQASDLTGVDRVYNVTQSVATMLNNTPALITAGFFNVTNQVAASYPQPTLGTPQPYWQLALISNLGTVFTLAAAASGTLTAVAMNNAGTQPRPFYTFTDDAYTANGYLGILDYLESKTGAASDLTSKYKKADVVDFRQDELSARDDNYWYWRRHFARYIGVPLFPMGPDGMGMSPGMQSGMVI